MKSILRNHFEIQHYINANKPNAVLLIYKLYHFQHQNLGKIFYSSSIYSDL